MAVSQTEQQTGLPAAALYALAALAGAVGSFAQAPVDQPAAMLVMLAAGFALLPLCRASWQAFRLGWCLGAAYFALSLRWILEPFQVQPDVHGWMAPFALLFLAGGLALIWAAAFGLARRVLRRSPWPLIVTWAGAELFRAYAFTGFPWANPAQGLLGSYADLALPVLGPQGLTLLALTLACAVTALPRGGLAKAGLGLLVCAGLSLPRPVPDTVLTDHIVRLVQPNAPQDEKWDADLAHGFVQRQVDFTLAPGDDPDLVIWPEMAIPYRASVAAPVFEAAAAASGGAPVLMGAMRDDPEGQIFNAALLLGPAGQIAQHYDKRHLVPFGEYMPAPGLFRSLGIRALAERTETGYTPGPAPKTLDLGPLGQALVLICYEAVFPQDLRGTARPDLLIQITNDAWFGQTLGPQQHLAQARMRALEQGLPLLRAANTGISAVIAPSGEVLHALSLNTADFLDAALPAPLPATLYSRTGDAPYALLLLALSTWLTLIRLRH